MLKLLKNYNIDIIANLVWVSVFVVFLLFTYAKWGSPIVDCGRDVYIAEQLIKGKALYTNVFYPYGPLTPYVLAFLFLCFGIHLNTAYICGIISTLLILFLVYLIARCLFKPLLSTIVVITVILECCFNPLVFNYIFPYTYSSLFCTLFSTILVLMICLHLKTPKYPYLFICGLITGLGLITKVEFGFAFALLLLLYLAICLFVKTSITYKAAFLSILATLVIPIIAVVIVLMQTGLYGINEYLNYMSITVTSISSKHIINGIFGWDYFISSFSELPKLLFMPLILFIVSNFTLFILLKLNLRSFLYPLITFIICSILFFLNYSFIDFYNTIFNIKFQFFSYIPLVCVIIIGFFIFKNFIARKELKQDELIILLITAFTLFISLRCFFKFNISTYGIYYIPLFYIVCYYFIVKFPEVIKDKYPKYVNFNHYWYSNFIIVIIYFLIVKTHFLYLTYNYPIITNKGTIITDKNIADPLNELIKYIDKHTLPGDEIILIPEEVLIYFLTDRPSATKFNDYLPIRLTTPEQENYLIDSIKTKRVKLVAISNRSSFDDYKYPFWGINYNQDIYKWLKNNYKLCTTFGNFQTAQHFYSGYGINVYQLNCPKFRN